MKALQASPGNWTSEKIQRFWEYYGRRTDLQPEYFSFQVGAGLTSFLRHTGRLREGATVLDYGCGPGFLVQHLLGQGVRCYGTDSSPEAVQLTNQKVHADDKWMGATVVTSPPLPYPDAHFDVVTCLETLEHLDDATLKVVISEVRRLLKRGGVALFTTPNEEDLTRSFILCPFCNTEYHKVQHLRSFSADSLRAVLESLGFNVLFCRGVNLWEFQRALPGWKDRSYRDAKDWFVGRWNGLLDKIRPRAFPFGCVFKGQAGKGGPHGPHLCAVVERIEGAVAGGRRPLKLSAEDELAGQ